MARKKREKRRPALKSKAQAPSNDRIDGRKIHTSDWISLFSVIIAAGALVFSIWQQIDERKAEQFKSANQAFVVNSITYDIKGLDNGGFGKEIKTSLHNQSPNPLFDVVLSASSYSIVSIPADQYHEVSIPESPLDRFELGFPTLPPGETIEQLLTYEADIFYPHGPREFLDSNFYFCFTDVNGQRWLADSRGSHRIPSDKCERGY